jgi:cellulose biosynthesis protein BcsQ
MTNSPILLEQRLREDLPNSKIFVRKDGAGWWRIRVISDEFKGLDLESRLNFLERKLTPTEFSIYSFPIAGADVWTIEEAENKFISANPFWSDVLELPDFGDSPKRRINGVRAQIVTFYSFKGGVGRSTALSITASLLAKNNYRVALIDFDLEAPGLTFFLRRDCQNSDETQSGGILDYVHDELHGTESTDRSVSQYVIPIDYKGPGRGEIFLVPAGKFSENYLHRLSEVSWRQVYLRENNPLKSFLKKLDEEFSPDVILIDSRTGLAEEGSIALLDLSDSCVLCLSPTEQNYEGMSLVGKAIKKQLRSAAELNIKFLLTPVASVDPQTRKRWLQSFEEWMRHNEFIDSGATEQEMYSAIDYNPNIIGLGSLINDIPTSISEPYQTLAEFISTSLPEMPSGLGSVDSQPKISTQRAEILRELQESPFHSSAADYGPDITKVFQKTGDFSKFLQETNTLVLGAKGTGKSMLFRLFVEYSDTARHLAANQNLSEVVFLGGHSKTSSGALLGKEIFPYVANHIKDDAATWEAFWMVYLCVVLNKEKTKLLANKAPHPDGQFANSLSTINQKDSRNVADFIVGAVNDLGRRADAYSYLKSFDEALKFTDVRAWVFYDELDTLAQVVDRICISSLLAWWLDTGSGFSSIKPKILLRRDLWKRLDFTNKAHYSSKRVELEWQEDDLLRLALRSCLNGSDRFKKFMEDLQKASLDFLDTLSVEQLRAAAVSIWGVRMGKGQKAYSHNWIRTRVSDAKGDSFPRSLSELLRLACERELTNTQTFSDECLLRPRSLIDSIKGVSEQRVAEFRQEYEHLTTKLDALNGERSPIDYATLSRILGAGETSENAIRDKIAEFEDAGIIQDRNPREDVAGKSYTVAELYLYGLGMVRKGQR